MSGASLATEAPDSTGSSRDAGAAPAQVLRFGVLTNGAALAPWQHEVLARLLETDRVVADCWLLAQPRAGAPVSDPFDDPQRPTAPAFAVQWLRSSSSDEIASTFSAVQARELHFILSFASPQDARFLLSAARWGVWQFFFGDWVRFRGESEGFWEVAGDVPAATALLAQLQPESDTVRPLKQGHVRAHPILPRATLRSLRKRCTHWPRQVCLELLDGVEECLDGPLLRAQAPPRDRRALASRARFVVRAVLRGLREAAHRLLLHEQWNIGLIDAPIQTLLDEPAPEPRWLCHPQRREFFADPFGVVHQGRLTIFCEHMDYEQGVGSIVALEESDPTRFRPVDIGPQVHRSYPFMVREGGRLFCIPETCAASEVALYEVEQFPDRWRHVATLTRDLPLVDATLFRYEERWWLAASLPAGGGANCELHLYHAPQLEGPWQPHAANPVKVDVHSARPGGTPFYRDGALYRPAQDCSTTYGRRVVINRIRRLSETVFDEEIVGSVEPRRPYGAGLHTLAAAGNVTLVDAKRHVFVPQQFWLAMRFAYGKLRGRRAAQTL